ncbi:hypothetical protein MIMGU_mgv1a019404mg [Erythranthe guttata]|uniref:Uncharacterized protein n=1 Tax=Erythranthe guttata TaxID=4155 RepID=A0A022RP53_ERYGU|nr:hypothetical protein MIMGU_mgv1a019404mg [Erythranthe guttata]
MVRESRKWMVLVATIWIQAFTGTNLDFSSYSSDMKSALGISQVQLNYLAVASDFGKAFGWCSGVSLLYFPTWFVLFFAAFVGLFGYGLQWLVIHQIISLPYILVCPSLNRGVVLGDEHSTRVLIRSRDFWLYYVAYLCGGTLGLVYSNNLGQISESLGFHSDVGSLVSLYSACSFFGRLLSTTPEFFRHKIYYARTGWLALALIPTPFAFLLLVFSDSKATLVTATAMIGLSSGFVFSAAVSITSELFGPNRAGVNHNILITNIPIGSLLYSLLAALIYEANIGNSDKIAATRDGSTVCVGRDCYRDTFVWWWLISLLGFVSSSLLFLRTKATYKRMEKHQKHKKKKLVAQG